MKTKKYNCPVSKAGKKPKYETSLTSQEVSKGLKKFMETHREPKKKVFVI